MKKILKKIEKQLSTLSKDQKQEVLSYYEEIISDRLENGETIQQIDASIDYDNITYYEDSNKVVVVKKAEKSKTTKVVLAIITFPIWITILALVFTFYALMASTALVVISMPVYVVLIAADLLITKTPLSDTVAYVGLILLSLSLISYLLYLLLKLMKKVNVLIINVFKKVF